MTNVFRKFNFCFIIAGYLLSSAIAFGSDTIVLNEKEDYYFIVGSQVEVLEDPSGSLNIAEVIKRTNQFSSVNKKYPYTINERTDSWYWLKIYVKQKSDFEKNWLIQFLNPKIGSAEIFYKSKNGIIHKQGGMLLPFKERQYLHRHVVFGIPVDTLLKEIYLRVKSRSQTAFSFAIRSHESFSKNTQTEYYLQGMFYGVILIMILYNLLVFASVKENLYLFYCLYAFACGLFTINNSGLGFEFLWPDFPGFNLISRKLFSILLLLSFVIYSARILNTTKYYPRLSKGIFYFSILWCIMALIGVWPSSRINELIYYVPFILVFVAGLLIIKKGYKPALYFIIGYSFIPLSFLISYMERLDLFPPNIFSVYSFNFGFMFEVLVFSYAMSERLRLIKKEKEEALYDKNQAQRVLIEKLRENEKLKDKVNKELEQKVSERTHELNEKNAELKNLYETVRMQAEELSKWNIRLDLDNRQLSNNIKEVMTSRVLYKNVELEEFNKIFPDETTCYRFLEELKWGKGYKCIECGNEKYFTGKNIFSRKCTRCRYEESIINNTIFQGSKLPITKLFYMLFLVYSSKGEITSTEMSEILQMRLKTCWAFSKKVKERMKVKKDWEKAGWDSLIMAD